MRQVWSIALLLLLWSGISNADTYKYIDDMGIHLAKVTAIYSMLCYERREFSQKHGKPLQLWALPLSVLYRAGSHEGKAILAIGRTNYGG